MPTKNASHKNKDTTVTVPKTDHRRLSRYAGVRTCPIGRLPGLLLDFIEAVPEAERTKVWGLVEQRRTRAAGQA